MAADPVDGTVSHGDCLTVLPQWPSGCVDLCYIDPPFATGRDFGGFDDRWSVPHDGFDWRHAPTETDATPLSRLTESLAGPHPSNYVAYLHRRLDAIRRVMADTASVFVHVDPRVAYFLRCSLDLVFGRDRFVNQIVWHYGLGGFKASRHLPRKYDTILWYAKSGDYTFNRQRGPVTPAMRARYNQQDAHGRYFVQGGRRHYQQGGKPWDDVWDIAAISPMANERTGYPTQKPLELLRRVILLASNADDLVLDAFCGSGTALVAAAGLGRRCCGIDIGEDACRISRHRLQRMQEAGTQTELNLPPGSGPDPHQPSDFEPLFDPDALSDARP